MHNELVATAQQEFFKDEAQLYRQLEVVQASLMHNAKIILPAGEKLINVVGDLAGMPNHFPGRDAV